MLGDEDLEEFVDIPNIRFRPKAVYELSPSDSQKRRIAQQFYDEVCRRAESNMQKTGKLEGAHYAAMQTVLQEWLQEPIRVCRLMTKEHLPIGNWVYCDENCRCY